MRLDKFCIHCIGKKFQKSIQLLTEINVKMGTIFLYSENRKMSDAQGYGLQII